MEGMIPDQDVNVIKAKIKNIEESLTHLEKQEASNPALQNNVEVKMRQLFTEKSKLEEELTKRMN